MSHDALCVIGHGIFWGALVGGGGASFSGRLMGGELEADVRLVYQVGDGGLGIWGWGIRSRSGSGGD